MLPVFKMRISILFLSLILRGRESLADGKKEKEYNRQPLVQQHSNKLTSSTGESHSIVGNENNVNLKKRSLQIDDWSQLGQTIYGETRLDLSGKDLALSDDGTVVAIGAVDNDGDTIIGDDQGHVRVYEYNEGTQTWIQMGDDINFLHCQLSLLIDRV